MRNIRMKRRNHSLQLIAIYALFLGFWAVLPAPIQAHARNGGALKPDQSELFPFLGLKTIELPVSPGTRRCCLLGTNLKMFGIIPGKQTIEPTELGHHFYGNSKGEFNGNIATCRAGFIDTAHVRYAADLVVKLALSIEALGPQGGAIDLNAEAGRARLRIKPRLDASANTAEKVADLAGSVALDITIWHEIATWYDYSAVPLYTEKGSAFSPEDSFSNQLGIALGKRALKISNQSRRPYEDVMTELLIKTLLTYGALPEAETIRVLDALELHKDRDYPSAQEAWFTPEHQIPDYRRLLKRQLHLYGTVAPSLPPVKLLPQSCAIEGFLDLPTPLLNQSQRWEEYQFEIKLKKGSTVFRGLKKKIRLLDQTQFPRLIEQARREIGAEWLQPFLTGWTPTEESH